MQYGLAQCFAPLVWIGSDAEATGHVYCENTSVKPDYRRSQSGRAPVQGHQASVTYKEVKTVITRPWLSGRCVKYKDYIIL